MEAFFVFGWVLLPPAAFWLAAITHSPYLALAVVGLFLPWVIGLLRLTEMNGDVTAAMIPMLPDLDAFPRDMLDRIGLGLAVAALLVLLWSFYSGGSHLVLGLSAAWLYLTAAWFLVVKDRWICARFFLRKEQLDNLERGPYETPSSALGFEDRSDTGRKDAR